MVLDRNFLFVWSPRRARAQRNPSQARAKPASRRNTSSAPSTRGDTSRGQSRPRESESQTSRLRFIVEGSHRIELSGGRALTPSLEVGFRHDGGDAETGTGIELGGAIAWSDPALGALSAGTRGPNSLRNAKNT